jgi:TolA-binding protein
MAMLKLNRVGDALKLLEDLETTSTHRDIAIEAAYRKGDAYIQKKDYDVAAQEFKNSQKKYPKEIDRFPNAMYNQAESLFAVRKYQESLEQYRQFLIHFPKEDHAAFAMTRVGELLGILGADKKRVMGTYMETVFRFGERPSANIAQMRLATEKMKTAREREFKPLMKQIEKFAGALKIPNMEQFTNVLVAEGFASRGRYQDAIDRLVEFYQTNPISADKDMISKRIVSYINQQLQSNVDQGDYIAALMLHQKYAESWLKNTPQLAARFNVGKSLEFSGAPEAGEKFYRDVLNSSLAINGTEESKILKANGTFPNLDEVNLRLAAVNDQMDRTARSFEYIKQIKSPEKLSEENQIERIRIMTGLLEKRGDPESAVRYLTELLKLWRGEASKVAPLYLKLAKLEEKLGRRADAEASLKKVDELYGYAKTADPEVHSQALLTLGDYYINEGKTKLAIAQLDKVLEKYEDNKSLAPVRFKVGELHFNNGDLNKAEKSWSGFKGPNADIWDKLAKEKMASVKWQDEYKKYLKRIPAMTGVQ